MNLTPHLEKILRHGYNEPHICKLMLELGLIHPFPVPAISGPRKGQTVYALTSEGLHVLEQSGYVKTSEISISTSDFKLLLKGKTDTSG